ncbi:class I SAM-dependent methyltransferase [Parasphingorhabdus cellanae]|uniref:Class I SAM-dependent methyltransferase n=1 Tax=Parasphingorhabdus cellanae TaxID=2806553 RepID=A0ABX7T5R7_9SPHN|nr:class I SAM-dependent methyltransferase [Parasphingorhabdus cellanae]QTD55814.1 class I SAM-dependent methyltransferase [Parasphingorhabdus cellanae]
MINPNNAPTSRFLGDVGLEQGMRVLDIGCANGLLTRELAALVGKNGHVHGVDSDEDRLAEARDQPAELDHATITYENVDLSGSLPGWEPFDAIVGRRILMYLPDAEETVRRLTALLKPDGLMIFQEHSATGMPFSARPIPQHKQVHDWIWRTIAAEQGTITMGLDLPKLFQQAELGVDHYRAEAIMLGSGRDQGIEDLASYMVGRVVDAGVADNRTIQPDCLTERLVKERREASPIVWDMAYLIGGKRLN